MKWLFRAPMRCVRLTQMNYLLITLTQVARKSHDPQVRIRAAIGYSIAAPMYNYVKYWWLPSYNTTKFGVILKEIISDE